MTTPNVRCTCTGTCHPERCMCPDDCNCRSPWRTNYCGCKAHATYAARVLAATDHIGRGTRDA